MNWVSKEQIKREEMLKLVKTTIWLPRWAFWGGYVLAAVIGFLIGFYLPH